MVKGMGGAMDLVASAENIIVAMMHVNKAGESKILKKCTLPLTGVGCVKKVVTELAVLEITPKGFKLLERAPGVSVEDIIKATEADLIIEGEIPEMKNERRPEDKFLQYLFGINHKTFDFLLQPSTQNFLMFSKAYRRLHM